ncbi:MAG: riboflavin biosynthesis protein RibF [Clostridia bacterium]|nr:riboflavin biosynthesis protein RibF [Clostridia bacterium]
MRILNTYEQAGVHKSYCIALGSFDGVHAGHQKLIEMLEVNAEKLGCASMVYTFGIHPRKILRPGKSIYMITSNAQRAEIMDKLGVDVLFLEDFQKIMNLSAEQFFHDILLDKFNVKCIIVGYNFNFGKNGEGNAEKLAQLGHKYGIKVEVVPPVLVKDKVVSSSLIRHKIHDGHVYEVLQYLGRPYSIQGNVIHGKKNGMAIGIRTANIDIGKEAILPLKGVYITDTRIDNSMYKSVTNIGVNPTFQGKALSLETHVLDFEGDLYNKEIEVYFLKRLRDEISFSSIDALIDQIKSDIQVRLDFEGCNNYPLHV